MKNIFRTINELVDSGVIETYAVGGAIGATFYVEPFSTTDVDIFFAVTVESSSLLLLNPLYEHLASKGFHPKGDAIDIEGWHVQFLPVFDSLTDEAVKNAILFDVDGEIVRVMSAEYLAAIALNTGRPKDFARVKMFFQQDCLDAKQLQELIKRFGLEDRWQRYKMLL